MAELQVRALRDRDSCLRSHAPRRVRLGNGEAKRRVGGREIGDVGRAGAGRLAANVAMAIDAEAIVVAVRALHALVLGVAAGAARRGKQRGGLRVGGHMARDLRVALEGRAVLYLL